ncbi:MAG: peptide ABC transporter substrate-binding protein [Dehalococcoidia bacterium]
MRQRTADPARPLLIGLALLTLVGAIAATAYFVRQDNDADDLPAGPRDSYIEGVVGTWQRVNPLFASTSGVDEDLVSLLFSGLLRLTPDGSVAPDLAELPEISDGGRTYTFTLRQGLTWHDGKPVSARDVAFTIERIVEPNFRGDPALVEAWTGVEVEPVDERTVVLRLRQANAPFLARSATIGILPEHLLSGLTAVQLFDSPFNRAPVGSGPYRLESLDTREAQLVANERYHLGAPKLTTLRFRFFPDSPSALRALQAREIQGAFFREALTRDERAAAGEVAGLTVTDIPRAAHLVLYLNNQTLNLFADTNVRRAISLALNRDRLLDRTLAGTALLSSSPVSPASWAYSQEYDRPTPDVPEARRLLERAGWRPGPSGVLTKEGTELRFTIRTDNDPARVEIATEIAAQLEPLGIRANVAATTFAVLQKDFLQERRYDAAVAGFDQGADPDPYFGWHSSQLGTAGLNIANFSDLVVDELIAKARTSNDSEVRKDLYRQYQEKWAELTPSIVLGYPSYVYARSSAIRGVPFGLIANPAQRFFDIQRWQN